MAQKRLSDFTLQNALEIQKDDLQKWKAVLNTNSYNYLVKKANYENLKGYSDPYNVFRGSSMSNFVQNLSISLANGNMTKYDYLEHHELSL
jgi:hypothetical protein